jgi:nitrate reductase (NAD(P)H)
MPHNTPWTVKVQDHPGSSTQEILDEPDWDGRHEHRIGFKDRNNRLPGITLKEHQHYADIEQAKRELALLQEGVKEGELLNFRDFVHHQEVIVEQMAPVNLTDIFRTFT